MPFKSSPKMHGSGGMVHSMVRRDGRMNACELTAGITAIANWLACQLTPEELELLGVSLTQLGDTLLTIVTQKSICCKGS